ncbi:MAG: TIGR02302 family protein, partial [Methyloceanibacter sp.]
MMKSVFRSKPTPPETPEDRALAKRFEQKVRLSLLALLFERVWEALLWPFLVVSTFLVVSLLDLWSITPPLAHRVLLGAFALALAVSFLPLIRIALPTREEALRRLETKANVKHRPATSYEDRLGTIPAKETALLWAAHRARLSHLIQKLRPTWPEPRTDRKDPYAIRALLLVALIAAVFAAGPNGFDRLRSAFSPAASNAPSLLRLDAWVTPPVYTEVPPIILADGNETVGTGSETFRALSVPERSELVVRARVPKGETVSLVTSNEEGTVAKAAEPKTGHTEGLTEFAVSLNDPGSAEVRIGGATIAKWRFDLIKDEPPTISLMANPTTTPRGALRLLYRADDDHGVANAEARFAIAEGAETSLAPEPFPVGPKDPKDANGKNADAKDKTDPLLEPPVMPLQLPHANAKHADGRATQDLTAHPWAGLKVRMTLVARDQAGQAGMSAPYEFVLPERVFTKPLAKAVVEQRKKLVRDPSTTEPVAEALDALTIGGDKVGEDSFTYLSLRDAYWRLMSNPSHEAIGSVVDQLWQIALRIEDGDLPEAERELKSAQDALSQALEKNASPDEIKQLVDNLRDALSRYMQALAKQAQDKGNMAQQDQQQNGDQLLKQQDLDKMLSNIEKLAQAGSKEMAERMLSELKD